MRAGIFKYDIDWFAKLRWRIKFYYRKYFVRDGVDRSGNPSRIDYQPAPAQALYFDGSAEGVYTEEELRAGANH